jgi:glycosyltransferase involved in cell wall biosynthesis
MKLKILHVVDHLGLGGVEQVCFRLMRGLRSQMDFEVFAVSGIEESAVGRMHLEDAKDLGIPVHLGTRLPPRFGGLLTTGYALARVAKRIRPDVIHVHTETTEAIYAAALTLRPSIRSIPLVRTIHNTKLWNKWRSVSRWSEPRLRHAHVVCVSQGALDSFMAEWKPTSLPRLIDYGVPSPPSARRRHHDENHLRILFAARFEDQKGTHLLPQIVRAIQPPAGQVYDLSIHGNGKHRPLLLALAADPPPGWRIRVDGAFPGLADALPDFDLFIMPSLFEGLGLAAVESLLAGVPVVATTPPGLREVFLPGYPWLAAPGDAQSFANVLSRAISERSRWAQTVAAAADFARRRFDLSVMCHAYARLYADAVSGAACDPVGAAGGYQTQPA